MEKIPQGRYTKEFSEEAARLVIEYGLSLGEVAQRLFLAKSSRKLGKVRAPRQSCRHQQKPTPYH